MIPKIDNTLQYGFEGNVQSGRTYRLDTESKRIIGFIDDKEAVKQTIFQILNTERYQYIIYSFDYGVEFESLFGEPVTYVCPELERRISEALMQDDRITGIDKFEYNYKEKGCLFIQFSVHTILGDIEAEKQVII